MATTAASASDMLPQLESARKLALSDPQVYTQVIPGILPIIGATAPLEVRRWGADFLAEGFASPSLALKSKEELVTGVVPVLKSMLENNNEDVATVRSAVQTAASIYGVVFRRIIAHPDQALLWNDMTAIKLNILRRMDNPPPSIKICCIKFVQKVVQVQTPGLIADPRRPDHNETSLALVPRNHPLLPLPNIEAETSGLLDRLLNVLQEQSGDPLPVDATLNCLAILIRTRPAVANKILSTVLNYNPFRHATMPMTPRQLVVTKSLERTTRALLRNVLKVHPNHPMESKMKMYLDRLAQSRAGLLAEVQSLKRPAEVLDGVDTVKRQKTAQEPKFFPPMPPPPNTLAQLFTLTQDTVLQQFEVQLLQSDMVSNIVGLLLQHIDSRTLDESIEAVRERYTKLQKAANLAQGSQMPMAGPTGIDDEDDYDPEFISGGSDAEVEPATATALEDLAQPMIELGPFELPKPPPLSATEIATLSDQTISRVFDLAASYERIPVSTRQKAGLNRLAAATNDKEAWITILTRLATRAPAGLDQYVTHLEPDASKSTTIKNDLSQQLSTAESEKPNLANRIRQTLFHYILDDWRSRINIAISWLTEEWYTDRLQQSTPSLSSSSPQSTIEQPQSQPTTSSTTLPNYTRTLNKLLQQLLPRFDASDSKLLIRFLSELPHLTADILTQVRQLSRDPGTIKICTLSLHYLVMFRPPVREIVLDTMQDIYAEGDTGVKEGVGKILGKWRPGFLESPVSSTKIENDKVEEEDTRGKINGIVVSNDSSIGMVGDGDQMQQQQQQQQQQHQGIDLRTGGAAPVTDTATTNTSPDKSVVGVELGS